MITDKNSKGYKIAVEIADKWKAEGELAAAALWDKKYVNDKSLVFWVQHAIVDTVHELVKGTL